METNQRIVQNKQGEWVQRTTQEVPFAMTLEHLDREIANCDTNIANLMQQKKEQLEYKADLEAFKLLLP